MTWPGDNRNDKSMAYSKKPIFIIAGEKQSGKTTFLRQLLREIAKKGIITGGFVSMHQQDEDSYAIRNIQTGEEVSLMQRVASFQRRPYHFKIHPAGVEAGRRWIAQLLQQPVHMAVIDEIGGYELAGELWCEGFTGLINSPIPVLFTIKTKHVKAIVKKWNIEPVFIFYPDDFINPKKACKRIENILKN